MNTYCQRGFVALMSTIIISAVLLVLVVGGSLSGWYSRSNVLDAELKQRSGALADACVDVILLQLASGPVTVGTTTVGTNPVGPDKCDKCVIRNTVSPYEVQAQCSGSYTDLRVEINPDTLNVTSWKEVPNF